VKRVDQRVGRDAGSGSRRRRQDAAVAGSADGSQASARRWSSGGNLYGVLLEI
jgi:hypothetical protein